MVTPPALIAATPVGATTAICFGQFSLIYFRNVVLPVPALPVRKIFLELWFTSSAANRNISLLRSYSILVIIYQIKKLRLLTRAFQWCGANLNLLFSISSIFLVAPIKTSTVKGFKE